MITLTEVGSFLNIYWSVYKMKIKNGIVYEISRLLQMLQIFGEWFIKNVLCFQNVCKCLKGIHSILKTYSAFRTFIKQSWTSHKHTISAREEREKAVNS